MDTEHAKIVLMGQPVRWLERYVVARSVQDQSSRHEVNRGVSCLVRELWWTNCLG
jgi:hypothetical protein